MAPTLTLPGVVESVPLARRFVRDALAGLDASGACDDALTLVSELATNAVLHARSEFTVGVARDGGMIRIHVHDLSAVLPRTRLYGPDSTTGRGMRLIASLASDWGVDRVPAGKAVWFDLPVDGARDVPAWDETTDVDALLASFDDRSEGFPPDTRLMAA